MAITRRGAVAKANASSSAPTITLPAGIEDGDWGFLAIAGSDPGMGTPSGWTLLLATEEFTTTFHLTVFKKQLTAAESSTAVSWSGENSAKYGIAVWVGACDDLDDFEFLFENTTSATHTNASLTNTAAAGTVSMWFERSSSPSTSITTAPTGTTLRASQFGTGGGACSAAVADDTTVEAGGSTIGGGSWVASASNVGVATLTFAPKDFSSGTPADVAAPAGALTITGTAPTVTTGGGASVSPPAGALALAGGVAVKTPPTRTDHVAALTYPQIIAHRGGNPGPENTMYAYAYAASLSDSVLLEQDLEVLSDGVLVLNHDDTIDRMAGTTSAFSTGDVSTFDSADWALMRWRVNTGFSGDDQPASFWHEVVTEYAGTPRILVPEVKDSTGRDELIRQILDEGLAGQVIVQSFNLADAQAAATAGLHAMHLDNTPDIATLDSSGIEYVGIDYATLTGGTGAGIVSDAHAAGMKVAVYLVNNVSNRDTAIAAGADLIFTNSVAALLLSVSVSPPAGAITINGTAPTVLSAVGASVSAPAGVATITGTAPTVTAGGGVALSPDAGTLTIHGTAPAVSVGTGATVAPAAGVVTIDATAPSVTGGSAANVEPPAGLLVLVGTAPSIGSGSALEVQAPAGLVTISATAPQIAAAANVEATAGLLALVGTAPTIAAAANVTPAAGTLALAGTAPVVTTVSGVNTVATGSLTTSPWSGSIDAQPRWRGTLIDPPT